MVFLIRYKVYIKSYHESLYYASIMRGCMQTNIKNIKITLCKKSKDNSSYNLYSVIFSEGSIYSIDNGQMCHLSIDSYNTPFSMMINRYNRQYKNVNYIKETVKIRMHSKITLCIWHLTINTKKSLLKKFINHILRSNQYNSYIMRVYINGIYRGSV